jgi:Trk K+ transport system NAD-binding subunit
MSGNSPSPFALTPGVFAQTEAEAAAERDAAMMARERAYEKDEEATREEILAAYADRSVQEALKAATAAYACASASASESNIAAAKSVLNQVTADAIVARARLREAQRLADIFAIASEEAAKRVVSSTGRALSHF